MATTKKFAPRPVSFNIFAVAFQAAAVNKARRESRQAWGHLSEVARSVNADLRDPEQFRIVKELAA